MTFIHFLKWIGIISSKSSNETSACGLTPPESQSNHSSQSDSGVSEMTSSSHTRSQSVVSSIFSDAWRRGTQGEVWTHKHTLSYPFLSLLTCELHFPYFTSASLPAVKGEGTYASSSLCRRRRREWRLDRKWCDRHGNSLAAAFEMLSCLCRCFEDVITV